MNRLHLLILLFVIVLIGNVLKIKTNKTYIETLIRQASRWSVAAQQDESPIIALLHANYGAGYLWALKDIATDQEIFENTGLDIIKFKKKIIDVQDAATKRVSRACPEFIGDVDKYLLSLGGDL
tara:strand:- start:120 stop:491 length:372 start_codon:yes stop_codon:yes gene_type:complete